MKIGRLQFFGETRYLNGNFFFFYYKLTFISLVLIPPKNIPILMFLTILSAGLGKLGMRESAEGSRSEHRRLLDLWS